MWTLLQSKRKTIIKSLPALVFCLLLFMTAQIVRAGLVYDNVDIMDDPPGSGTVKRGLVWMSDNVVLDANYRSSFAPIRAAIIVTPDASSEKAMSLPKILKVSNKKSGGWKDSPDLKWTLVGNANLNIRGVKDIWWNEPDFMKSATYMAGPYGGLFGGDIPVLASESTIGTFFQFGNDRLTGNVRIAIICEAATCKLPLRFKLPSLAVRMTMRDVASGAQTSEATVVGREQVVTMNPSTCTFSIGKTTFTDIVISSLKKPATPEIAYGKNGEMFTTVTASCTRGYADKVRHAKIHLAPTQGTVAGQPNIAKSDKNGIGIVYTMENAPQSCKAGLKYNEPQTIGEFTGQEMNEKRIYWGVCRYDATTTGPWSSTINYKIWID